MYQVFVNIGIVSGYILGSCLNLYPTRDHFTFIVVYPIVFFTLRLLLILFIDKDDTPVYYLL